LEIIGMNPKQEEKEINHKCAPQNRSQLVFRLYQYLRKHSDTMKKVQVFLKYPFSMVKYSCCSKWQEQVEQEKEISLHEFVRLIDRLGRLHARC